MRGAVLSSLFFLGKGSRGSGAEFFLDRAGGEKYDVNGFIPEPFPRQTDGKG
jgi:hypothetical protein